MLVEICELRFNCVAVLANEPLLAIFGLLVLLPLLQPLFFFTFNQPLRDLIGVLFLGEGGLDESIYIRSEQERDREQGVRRWRVSDSLEDKESERGRERDIHQSVSCVRSSTK